MSRRVEAAISLVILGLSFLYVVLHLARDPVTIKTDLNDMPAEAVGAPRELSNVTWI